MKVTSALFGLILLVAVQAAERPPIDPSANSFSGVLSLNWTAGYCHAMVGTQNECNPAKLDLWDSKSFTLHGLWPSSATQAAYEDFSLNYVEERKKLHDEMANLWPPQTNYPILDPATADSFNQHWLWEHEWNKHGKDFANILQVLNPDKWAKAEGSQLQVEYFSTVLGLYNQKYQGFQKIPDFGKKYYSKKSGKRGRDYIISKADLSALLGIPATHFLAKCEKGDVLSEVHICWRDTRESGINDLPCSRIQGETIYPLTDSCPGTFQLVRYGGYGKKWQRRVTRYCKCRWAQTQKRSTRKECQKNCRKQCRSRKEKRSQLS